MTNKNSRVYIIRNIVYSLWYVTHESGDKPNKFNLHPVDIFRHNISQTNFGHGKILQLFLELYCKPSNNFGSAIRRELRKGQKNGRMLFFELELFTNCGRYWIIRKCLPLPSMFFRKDDFLEIIDWQPSAIDLPWRMEFMVLGLLSGKLLHNYGTSPFLMGKSW